MLLTTHAACQPADDVIWLEAESSPQAADPQIRIDRDTSDYGSMAESAASGKVFVRFSPGVTLPLPPFTVRQAGERVAWVRAFNLAGRRVTVAIDGKPVADSTELVVTLRPKAPGDTITVNGTLGTVTIDALP